MKRVKKIMDLSQNILNKNTNGLIPKLDQDERNIFISGQKRLVDFEQWKKGMTSKLTTSRSVVNHRKRKRTEDN